MPHGTNMAQKILNATWCQYGTEDIKCHVVPIWHKGRQMSGRVTPSSHLTISSLISQNLFKEQEIEVLVNWERSRSGQSPLRAPKFLGALRLTLPAYALARLIWELERKTTSSQLLLNIQHFQAFILLTYNCPRSPWPWTVHRHFSADSAGSWWPRSTCSDRDKCSDPTVGTVFCIFRCTRCKCLLQSP